MAAIAAIATIAVFAKSIACYCCIILYTGIRQASIAFTVNAATG